MHKYKLIFAVLLLVAGCKTAPVIPTDYTLLSNEVSGIVNAENITPEQKIILQHSAAGLKQADAIATENTKLRDELITASKATSRVVYVLVGGAIIIIILIGAIRILRP